MTGPDKMSDAGRAKRNKWKWYECLHHQFPQAFGVGPDDPDEVPTCHKCERPMTPEPRRTYPKRGQL